MRLSFGGAFLILACGGVAIVSCSLDSSTGTGVPNPRCTQYAAMTVGDTLRDSVVASSSCREGDQSYENLYQFSIAAQTKLRLVLSSPHHIALVEVGDSTGTLVANSSISGPLDTTATLRMILKPGLYKVGVNSAATTASGSFRMIALVDNSAVTGCGPFWVTTGITTAQTITSADCKGGPQGTKYYTHSYLTLFPAAGELKLSEHSTAFIPMVLVTSETNGALKTFSSIDSTNTVARVDYLPTATDLLLLWVGSSDSLQTGAYSLTIQ